MISFHIVNIV